MHRPVRCVQHNAHVFRAARLHLLEPQRDLVDALWTVRHGVDLGSRLDGSLQPQGAAGVLEEQALATPEISIDVMKPVLDFARQFGRECLTLVGGDGRGHDGC
jgi:hypothetical protein